MINHIKALRFLTFVRNDIFPYYDTVSQAGIQSSSAIITAVIWQCEGEKNGHFRLEEKDYIVRDGDIISIRFSV